MFLKKELTEYNRYQAFAVHMAISLVIFLILLVCITQYWYPDILFDTANGWKAIGLIVGIDLILGPLLTLLVFNHNKTTLKMDLWIIALVQTAALAYGTWTIHQTRPVALAFVNNHFITIYAESELGKKVALKTKELKTNELFYVFDDSRLTEDLEVDSFAAYQDHAHSLKTLTSPYINDDLVNIDPLMSASRFIQIEPESGKIIKFIKK